MNTMIPVRTRVLVGASAVLAAAVLDHRARGVRGRCGRSQHELRFQRAAASEVRSP